MQRVSALLSYNGCVRGTNTPDCRAYPEKVRAHVENDARNICAGRDYHECVALPLWAALRDTLTPRLPLAALASGAGSGAGVGPSTTVAARVWHAVERMGNYLLGIVSRRAD